MSRYSLADLLEIADALGYDEGDVPHAWDVYTDETSGELLAHIDVDGTINYFGDGDLASGWFIALHEPTSPAVPGPRTSVDQAEGA